MKRIPGVFRPLFLAVCILGLYPTRGLAGVDPNTDAFTYSATGGIDETLGQIALYLLDRNWQEGSTFLSQEVEEGIVGYQLRYFDNGNRFVDADDWLSLRRYRIPAQPDTTRPPGYYKNIYIELVDTGLDGIDRQDYYFIEGRRFRLADQPADVLAQYQIQMENGITTFIRNIGYQTITGSLGSQGHTSILKEEAYEDGSLPTKIALGLGLRYVFRPHLQNGVKLNQEDMVEVIRQRIGFVYSATTGYTDLSGYRFRDIADQIALLQRNYDPIETPVVALILGALFDTDGDGLISQENLQNGYTRFRELHQQLVENARAANRRIVLPGEKLNRLRQEYEAVHKKPFKF